MARFPGGFRQSARNGFFTPAQEGGGIQYDNTSTAFAPEADVGTDAKHGPDAASAGVRLAGFNNVPGSDGLLHGAHLPAYHGFVPKRNPEGIYAETGENAMVLQRGLVYRTGSFCYNGGRP